jgi:hypothetical protein
MAFFLSLNLFSAEFFMAFFLVEKLVIDKFFSAFSTFIKHFKHFLLLMDSLVAVSVDFWNATFLVLFLFHGTQKWMPIT